MDSHAVFLRSAGATRTDESRLVEAVRRSIQNQGVDSLQRDVRKLRFDDIDAFLIAATVAITRNFALPMWSGKPRSDLVQCRKRLIDGLAVTFMFNAINRIANAYDLQPEWATLRRTEPTQRITRSLMAFGLPFQMPLANDSGEASEPVIPQIASLLHHFGVDAVSPVWRHLHVLPPVEIAIHQLLWVAANCSETDDGLLNAVTHECLSSHANADHADPAGQGISVWRQLFAEPYKALPSEVSAFDASQGTKLDLTFRVALLAAVHKLNDMNVQNLIVETFEDMHS